MKKPQIRLTRRQVLKGAGGFTLALPFLPSIIPIKAYAADLVQGARRRFVGITTNHGGILASQMFPEEAVLTETVPLYPGMNVRRGALQRRVQGDQASVSAVLRAPASELTEQLTSKMSLLRGIDIPFYIAHHTGGHFGNYARNDGNGADDPENHADPTPTIDQVLAWSSTFYPDLSGIRLRSMYMGDRDWLSWGFSSPSDQSGTIQEIAINHHPRGVFDQIFVPPDEPEEQRRMPIVDRVIDGYRSLRQSNRRLSREDRQRLDDHMDRLFELQRRLNVAPSASCRDVSAPGPGGSIEQHFAQVNDVIAAAFLCDTSRVAIIGVQENRFVDFTGDWHQDVAHQWANPGPQATLQDASQRVFRHVFLDLLRKLDVEEEPGTTVLDTSLVAWSQESGEETHESNSIPLVLGGGAAGFFQPGSYIDYRNRTPQAMRRKWDDEKGYTGLLYQQWLATALQAMGLPPSEWQSLPNNGPTGYGSPTISSDYSATHVTGVVENASEPLPLLCG